MNPSDDLALVSDCGGLIQALALALPAAFFSDSRVISTIFKPLAPIANLLSSLPDGVEVRIFVDRTCLEDAALWAGRLEASCSIELLPVGTGQDLITSPWIQDLVHARTARSQTGERTEIIATSANELVSEIATHLQIQMRTGGPALAGGNQLVESKFRLIGASEVISHSSLGQRQGVDRKRWNAIAALDKRSLAVFGYRAKDLSCELEPSAFEGQFDNRPADDSLACVEIGSAFSSGPVHQCGFHVDQFVTVTGLFSNRRPLLIVADPISVGGTRDRFNETLKRQLNASVLLLLQQGFAVIRNPVPLSAATDTGKRVARLYNNVLLENARRPGRSHPFVWVPQFADIEPLEMFDRQNLEVWRRLGFEPVPVQGWSHFAGRNGAIRCATKVLRRKGM